MLCSSCDKELGEVMVLPGISSHKEGSNEYYVDTIKCFCPCGEESFQFKFDGRIKFAPAFPIKEQYTNKNEIIVEYEKNNSNR